MPGFSGQPFIGGPLGLFLAASADLGPSHARHAQLTVALRGSARPEALIGWADAQGLSTRWRAGDQWAIVEGAPSALGGAFGVAVHDYRGKRGQVFYASGQQPAVPAPLHSEISELGRILGYIPHHTARPSIMPLVVPDRGLTRESLLRSYHADELAKDGYTGKGTTVVIFAVDGFDQSDLDRFATEFGLPQFTPTVVGGSAGESHGETVMDLEVVHAIAPDAHTVVVNARRPAGAEATYENIGALFEAVDQQFPGAVWSFSIGWGCDKMLTAADLAPLRSALAAAQKHGTTAFDASGDLAGLECKGGQDWSSPPGPADIGLDSVASLPEMTVVGGTTLSTDAGGGWQSEQSWFDATLSQGTSGGVSTLIDRPGWQKGVSSDRGSGRRLTPDVAAVADPFTGVKIVVGGNVVVGGGTSQSAPVWAGLAAMMTQYLAEHGGQWPGNLNPFLYRIATGAARPAFHDVTLGSNAVDRAAPGYDLVTGLGTPDVDNLVHDILDLEKKSR